MLNYVVWNVCMSAIHGPNNAVRFIAGGAHSNPACPKGDRLGISLLSRVCRHLVFCSADTSIFWSRINV